MTEPGSGEAAERAQRRQRTIIIAGLAAVGFVVGLFVGFHEGRNLFDGREAGWPPALALGVVAAFLAAVIGGGLALQGRLDEVEMQMSAKAGSLAGLAFMIVYPVWFALWKGGFVVEPIHWVLFAIFWLVLVGSGIYYRYR